jgi:hypothetical protein
MTLKDKIAKARELREKATQGVWKGYTQKDGMYSELQIYEGNKHKWTVADAMGKLQNDKDNFKMLAFAANNILSLVDALEKCLEFVDEHCECASIKMGINESKNCESCSFLKDLEHSEELTKERE